MRSSLVNDISGPYRLRRLVVRMPTRVHEFFIDEVEDDIRSQLKEIHFAASKSRYHPDISFGHKDAQYAGVIIEVAYSQKKKRLSRLAENCYSDANVRVVVGLDIAYGKESRKATLSIWRPQLSKTTNGYDLEAVEKAANEVLRDKEGNPVEHPGLRLHLSDFTCKELAREEMGDEDTEICISRIQLCQYVATAESNVQRALRKESLVNNVNKRKRSETPPEEMQSDDEVKYAKQEERAAKRADHDIDYEDKLLNKSPSD
ncbi:hypothetical protein CC78DRAFT_611691 [Lojkania enalia]|uniref:Uncharacterized protein n=1 Tax=Lojkania enalia TaxID=147567 RepID=A0A9P4TQX8_9PLEO|nr:hypothetical protein CC78DRAFT_611691 [Didymosphaeria enalia]